MAWIQIRLNSTNEKAEKISDFLEEIGSVSVTFMDSQDTPIFEPLPGETRLWGNMLFSYFFCAFSAFFMVCDYVCVVQYYVLYYITFCFCFGVF